MTILKFSVSPVTEMGKDWLHMATARIVVNIYVHPATNITRDILFPEITF
jgi:hypothetical protein